MVDKLLPSLNTLVSPTFTDLYQLTMVQAYYEQNQHNQPVCFDLFIRKAPFKGEFCVFAGLEDALRYISNFKFSAEEMEYIKEVALPDADPEFYEYLANITTNNIEVWSLPEGSVAFPKIPFMTISGPLAIVQLLETTLLNLVNFATLVTTNAARHCMAVDYKKTLIEFGTRRAQGPDGALSAAKYAYLGGFVGTSNVKAGMIHGINISGTHSHSYVMSFQNGWNDLKQIKLKIKGNVLCDDFVSVVKQTQEEYKHKFRHINTNQNELAAFTAYAITFPTKFLALVDTYDVINSGAPNFCIVALALAKFGIKAVGVRLDSGDLAHQSVLVKKEVIKVAQAFELFDFGFDNIKIVASSDISESVLYSIENQENDITTFGVGTHLVTCKNQPALGGVYKLVNINGNATMKLSETVEKTTIPDAKKCFRLFNKSNVPVVDLMLCATEPDPEVGKAILCRDPFNETKRTNVTPSKVVRLHQCYYKNGKLQQNLPELSQIRDQIVKNLSHIRTDHLRPLNPTPYKVSVSQKLYELTHQLWFETRPIGNIE